MSQFERFVVNLGANLIPRRVAFRLSRALLATQGVGWAGPTGGVESSGEKLFLKLNIEQPPTREDIVVFDVGANIGDYAAACINVNRFVQLHCFEPSKAHSEHLRLRLNKLGAVDVVINNFGLSDKAEDRPLFKDSEITGLASLNLRDLSHIGLDAQLIREVVALQTGDDYMKKMGIEKVDLLKIDVEGWEMAVLMGFESAIQRKTISCIQFEFGHAHIERRENFRDFFRFFSDRGYMIGSLKPNGKVDFECKYDEVYENYLATNYIATPVV